MEHAETLTRKRLEGPAARIRPREEIARLGTEIYESDIRRRVEDDHDGRVVAIDVDSRNWAIADSELAAAERLRERHPAATDVWLLRVGYRAMASIGGGSLRRIG